ncbi:MAG: tRNA epoxyqueuosine(34) reductase QueG [Bacteroidota bacterium]|nr:tRNA epoxyqueuosine(34) reductase QueG [Bacteroidota bacterium]
MTNENPGNGTPTERSARVKEWAKACGFSACGIADAGFDLANFPYKPFYSEEITELAYLLRNSQILNNPKLLMPSAQSIVALLYNYYPAHIQPETGHFIVAKYAYGKDYHKVMKRKLDELIRKILEGFGKAEIRGFSDSGKIREKIWAQQCGIGWQGKNTLIINPHLGSFSFIGILLTDIVLTPDPPETDHCANCTRCVDACPTGALANPYTLNPSRCISFLTIESKKPFPEELPGLFHDRIYGCDICQDICPFNKKAIPSKEPDFIPTEEFLLMRKKDWSALSEERFAQLFKNSPLNRVGFSKISSTIRQIKNR